MYVDPNFPTKKALKEAVASGRDIAYFQPGPFGGNEPTNGSIFIEGPHFPEPHRWYAQATVKDGRIIKVK
jgi:hypothetical protein